MKKSSFAIIALLVLVISSITALAVQVDLDPHLVLRNNTFYNRSNFVPNVNVSFGNVSTYTCFLYSNENTSSGVGMWREIQTSSSVLNLTNSSPLNGSFHNFSSLTLADNTSAYLWNVYCNATLDPVGNWSRIGNFSFFVDTVAPSVTEIGPAHKLRGVNSTEKWINNETGNNTLQFIVNVSDNNPDQCTLYLNYNNTGTNATSINRTWDVVKFRTNASNMTATNITVVNHSIGFIENNSGIPWSIFCNDTAGNFGSVGGSFKVDTELPSPFEFNLSLFRTNNRQLFNNTIGSDTTPQVGWNITKENNFHRYEINFYRNIYGNTTGLKQTNVTTNTTLVVNITSLLELDAGYVINITAFDLAENYRTMDLLNFAYNTTSINRVLRSGWNFLGNPGEDYTLSQVLNWTGADTVSKWNYTNEFQSHVSGGSNGDTLIRDGEVVLVHVTADSNFSDTVVNNSRFADNATVTLRNNTNSDWSLVMNEDLGDDMTLQRLDSHFNCANSGNCSAGRNSRTNVTLMAKYNNSANVGAKSIPYVGNWSINNGTVLKTFEPIWVFLGNANAAQIILNWTAVNATTN